MPEEEAAIPPAEVLGPRFIGRRIILDCLRSNPKGVVPTLIDDGKIITESTLIAEYLDDIANGPSLKPDAPFDRAQMRLYAKACDEGLHQGVAVLSYSAMFMDRLRAMTPGKLEGPPGQDHRS